jgi:hypothetical protein
VTVLKASVTLIILSTASVSVGTAVAIIGNVLWYGDASTFISYAYNFAHQYWNPNLQWRSPGYPLVLIATGVLSGSLLGLITLQTLAGAAMPTMIYGIVAPADPGAAIAAGIVAVVSLIPYALELTIYHDQLIAFSLVATGYLLARWWTREGPIPLYGLGFICLVAGSLRPTAYLVAIVCLILAFIRGKDRGHLAVCAALFLAVVASFAAYRHRNTVSLPPSVVAWGPGAQLFFNVYMNGVAISDREEIVGSIAAYLKMHSTVETVRTARGAISQEDYGRLFGDFGDDGTALADAMLSRPNETYYWVIVKATDNDGLLGRAALQSMMQSPLATARFLFDNARGFVIGPPWKMVGSAEKVLDDIVFYPFTRYDDQPRQAFEVEFAEIWLTGNQPSFIEESIDEIFSVTYLLVSPSAFLLMVAGCLGSPLLPKPQRVIPLLVFAIYMTHIMSMALLINPEFRYHIETMPLALAGGGFGIAAIRRTVEQLFIRTPS